MLVQRCWRRGVSCVEMSCVEMSCLEMTGVEMSPLCRNVLCRYRVQKCLVQRCWCREVSCVEMCGIEMSCLEMTGVEMSPLCRNVLCRYRVQKCIVYRCWCREVSRVEMCGVEMSCLEMTGVGIFSTSSSLENKIQTLFDSTNTENSITLRYTLFHSTIFKRFSITLCGTHYFTLTVYTRTYNVTYSQGGGIYQCVSINVFLSMCVYQKSKAVLQKKIQRSFDSTNTENSITLRYILFRSTIFKRFLGTNSLFVLFLLIGSFVDLRFTVARRAKRRYIHIFSHPIGVYIQISRELFLRWRKYTDILSPYRYIHSPYRCKPHEPSEVSAGWRNSTTSMKAGQQAL